MYVLERKIVSQLLFLICAVTLMGAQASAITLSELRQIITHSQESVATAHLVYVEEFNENRPVEGDPNSIDYKLETIRNHRNNKVDAILDYKIKRVRFSQTDLRDVDALLKEYALPPEQRINVSESKFVAIQGTYEMQFVGTDVSNGQAQLVLCERPDIANYMLKMRYLGVINNKLLSEGRNPILTEINSDGQSSLRIQLTGKGQNAIKGTIECDPSLGYRFRRIEWSGPDGRLIRETIADDYRDVNGIPYPFFYIERSFDENGKVSKESRCIFENVQLGIDVSEEDFKIFVPTGTILTDVVLSMTTYEIEQDSYMGIDDMMLYVWKQVSY